MPAAAMRTRRQAKRLTMPDMIIRRTRMAAIIPTATTITMTSIATMTMTTAIPMLMTTSKPHDRPPRRAAVRADAAQQDATPASGSGMQENEAAAQYRLMTWLSPAFPVGAFSYSSGIECAGEAGESSHSESLRLELEIGIC